MMRAMEEAAALARQGRFDEALRAIEARLAAEPRNAGVLDAAGEVYGLVGNYEESRRRYQEALDLHIAARDAAAERATLVRLAQVHRSLNEHDLAERRYRRALEIGAGDPAPVFRGLGGLKQDLGDYRAAADCFSRAAATGDRLERALARAGEGAALAEDGQHDRALALLEEAAAEFEALGEEAPLATTVGDIGIVRLDRGEFDSARGLLERSLELARKAGGPWTQARALMRLGRWHAEAGDPDEAERLFRECITASRIVEMPFLLPEALRLRARLRLSRNDERGRRDAEEAVELAREGGNPSELAESLSTLGRFTGSLKLIEEARELDCPTRWRTDFVLAEDEAVLRRRAGDREGAMRLLEIGERMAAERGLRPFAGRFRSMRVEDA